MISDDNAVNYWIELSEYDLKVAKSLFEKEHYLYVGFMCHQSVEKMLKAIYVNKNKSVPPYTHRLDKLIELTEWDKSFSQDKYGLIDELNPLNIQARYPSYKNAIYKLIGKGKAKDIFSKTGDLILWLKTLIS